MSSGQIHSGRLLSQQSILSGVVTMVKKFLGVVV